MKNKKKERKKDNLHCNKTKPKKFQFVKTVL